MSCLPGQGAGPRQRDILLRQRLSGSAQSLSLRRQRMSGSAQSVSLRRETVSGSAQSVLFPRFRGYGVPFSRAAMSALSYTVRAMKLGAPAW